MLKSQNHIFTLVGLLMFVVTIVLLSPQRSFAQPPGGQPTQDVNVVNTPSVDVGTPDVSVVNTPTVDIGNQPIDIRDVDHPALQAVHQACLARFEIGEDYITCSINIPSGKILVIEMVTAEFFLNKGEVPELNIRVFLPTIDGSANSAGILYPIVLNKKIEFASNDLYLTTQPLRMYANAGIAPGTVEINLTRINSGSALTQGGRIIISGHLIDN
jgi:hypothetical protein